MSRRTAFVLAALVAAAPPRAAHAGPRCSMATSHDPCDSAGADSGSLAGAAAGVAPRSDRALAPSPWLDAGPPPPWMSPVAASGPADHRARSMVTLGGIYAAFATWMYFAWYYDKPRLSGFEVGGDGWFGDTTYAGGSDKLGHTWANMALTRGGAELLRSGGWSPRHAAVISAALSWSLFLFVEIKDGFYYEMSPGDLTSNTIGALLGATLTEWPALDRLIDFRVEYWPSAEYRAIVGGSFVGSERVNSVNIAEDYSGQTYFLALHLGAVPHPKGTPRWLDDALDYVDVGVGFHSSKYKPDPPPEPPYIRRQELFLGATIDLQHVVDRALGGRRSRAAHVGRAIGHGLLEIFSPPYSILPAVSATRSPDE
ncbi:MAG TPA: DUF2279 domain-containing protein [Kofleriaceae bacterium]|nr:DUF2279 domain-containing protein [Kofleriaceae bacterium]